MLQLGEATVVQLEWELVEEQALGKSLQADNDRLRELAAAREAELAAVGREKASALMRSAELETSLRRQRTESGGLQDLLAQARASVVEASESLAKQTAAPPQPAGHALLASGRASGSVAEEAPTTEIADTGVRSARFEAPAPTDAAPDAAWQGAESPTAHLEDFVRDWAAAWPQQDVDGYLSRYAADFEPADGASRTAWAKLGRQRVLRPKRIEVEVSGFETARLDGGRARVTFEQAYRTDHYQDRVSKTLVLGREGDDWKILREDSRPLPATSTTPG